MDILVASSLGGTQCVKARAQGGKPMPWNQPLTIQMRPIASALAKASGGTLALEDSPAGGLAVVVTLPAPAPAPATHVTTGASGAPK